MTDYERVFRQDPDACGRPFPEIVEFFDHLRVPSKVLDLGCGQGRDALMLAARGFHVTAVDLSPTGVSQMLAAADRQRLAITGVVADLRMYEPDNDYDVVLLDRVVHMFQSSSEKRQVLSMAIHAIGGSGHAVIADTPANIPLIEAFFDQFAEWQLSRSQNGFRFFEKARVRNAHAR